MTETIHCTKKLGIKKVPEDWFGAFPGLKPYNKEEDRAYSKYE